MKRQICKSHLQRSPQEAIVKRRDSSEEKPEIAFEKKKTIFMEEEDIFWRNEYHKDVVRSPMYLERAVRQAWRLITARVTNSVREQRCGAKSGNRTNIS